MIKLLKFGVMNMSLPKKFYRWKDTSEFSVHCGKWDEWKPLNTGETTEEDILYYISKGLAYQICEIEIKNVIGYEAEETSY